MDRGAQGGVSRPRANNGATVSVYHYDTDVPVIVIVIAHGMIWRRRNELIAEMDSWEMGGDAQTLETVNQCRSTRRLRVKEKRGTFQRTSKLIRERRARLARRWRNIKRREVV